MIHLLVAITGSILFSAYPVIGQGIVSTDDEIPYSKVTYTYKNFKTLEIQAGPTEDLNFIFIAVSRDSGQRR